MRLMPLARQLASRYRNSSVPREDLVQIASIGLLHAIDRYDPSRGTSFTAFAVPTITGELRRHLRDHTWAVRVPRDVRELADRLHRVASELSVELRRTPTATELARHLDRSVEEVLEARAALAVRSSTSLEQHVTAGHRPLAEVVDGGSGGIAEAEARMTFEDHLSVLPPRDREVLRLRFCEDMFQGEIGRRLGISQMQVSRTLVRALGRLHARGVC